MTNIEEEHEMASMSSSLQHVSAQQFFLEPVLTPPEIEQVMYYNK